MTTAAARPACVILAGGAGRRIGGRKAFVELGGRPLIAHVIDRLAPQVARMAINASPDAALVDFGLPVLPDEVPGRGPLGGILAAMDWAARHGEAQVVTVSVDTPFLPADLVQRLSVSDAPAAFAATGDGPHATTGLWSVDLQGALREALDRGARKVRDWTASIGAEAVMFDDASAFMNINTPEDLRQAEARLP
jgi:molybdopterin-guanine dinucleotide biosynthesis protein A